MKIEGGHYTDLIPLATDTCRNAHTNGDLGLRDGRDVRLLVHHIPHLAIFLPFDRFLAILSP